MSQRVQWSLYVIVLWLGAWPVCGQWTTQTISLQPGWNAIYLEVQPQPDECDLVFAGLPVESVWAWNRRFTTVQFVQDVNNLVPGQPDWLVYTPQASGERAVRNLFTLQGGRPYLIKLPNGASPVNWTVKGQPVLRTVDWLADSLNFVGFPMAAGGAPTFQAFFAGSPAHRGQVIHRLSANGLWEQVTSPSSTSMRAGEAFWVYSDGPSKFSGPLEVQTEQREGLVYGRILTELTLRIRNASATPASINLRTVASQSPPSGEFPLLAGQPPLSYYRINTAANEFGWIPLPPSLDRTDLAPGEEWLLRLEVNRAGMTDFTLPPGATRALYQGLLEITDTLGSRCRVGVSAEGLKMHPPAASVAALHTVGPAALPAAPHPRAGLWVGSASIQRVSQPAAIGDSDKPVATASPFQFRLILHVDDSGKVQLLQKVLQMFKPGTLKPDPGNPALKIVDQPGRHVLVADDSLIPRFTGATLRDGQSVARRISSSVFGFARPVAFAGPGEFGSGKLLGEVSIDYDDRLNPFKHRYHPDHDNLDERFERKVPEGAESFSVTRQIEIEFTAEDPEKLAIAGWGDNQLGGIYRETVAGLQSKVIHAEGVFRLTQISRIGVLNDGL